MSIESSTELAPTSKMGSEKHSKKKDKDRSSHGEKKRKREHKNREDGVSKLKSKSSKKYKDDKSSGAGQTIDDSNNSPFHLQTSTLYLPLAPISQSHPLEGLCAEHLSPLILTYYPPFSGVILSYSNPRLSEKQFGSSSPTTLLQTIDEYAVSWTWVTAEFLLFKPSRSVELEGYVNLQNEGHLGVVCWNLFNASIERKRLPADWKWIDVATLEDEENEGGNEGYAEEGAGYYIDGEGKKLEGMVKFRVKDIETSHDRERGFLSIEGTMLEIDEEEALAESEKSDVKDPSVRRIWPSKALGATALGAPVEKDLDAEARKKKPYRN